MLYRMLKLRELSKYAEGRTHAGTVDFKSHCKSVQQIEGQEDRRRELIRDMMSDLELTLIGNTCK